MGGAFQRPLFPAGASPHARGDVSARGSALQLFVLGNDACDALGRSCFPICVYFSLFMMLSSVFRNGLVKEIFCY